MIGSVDWFGQCFGSVPEGEIEWNARVAKAMIREGLAVVVIKPNDKLPACTLNARDAKRANTEAQDAAKEKGNPGWDKVLHPCGVSHAITEESHLTRTQPKRLLTEGANLAIAVGKGERRVAVADLDTVQQIATFRELFEAHSGEPFPGLSVASPGVLKGTWVHKDGGHVWFDVPEGIELPESKGKFSWCPCHQFRTSVKANDGSGHKMVCPAAFAFYWGSGYVLVPPSVRPEGPYRLVGSAVELPAWLADMAGASVPDGQADGSTGFLGRFEQDPIDEWAELHTWEEILTDDGFTPAGYDTCGCPYYTRPGDASHSKSVTGHEETCSYYDGTSGQAPIHIWSDSVLGGEATLSKLNWITEYRYDGDRTAAMSALGLEAIRGDEDSYAMFEGMVSPKAKLPESSGSAATDESSSDDESELSDAEFAAMLKPAESGSSGELAEVIGTDETQIERMVRREAGRIYIRKLAEEMAREWIVGETWEPPDFEDDLGELLALPRPEEKCAIDRILTIGGNLMLSAEYKSGKTTLLMEFIRSLADGVPVLGKFEVKTSGNVGVWNLELTANMFVDWLEDAQIQNPGRVKVLNLRGQRVPLETKAGQDWAVKWLADRNIQTWIIDPIVKAMIGFGSENDNDDVTVFTDRLDDIKKRAGVGELIIAHHTGRTEFEAGKERARGATRWDDWPDTRAILTKDAESGTRFIRFAGRIDREIPERALTYDTERRRYAMVGDADPWAEADRKTIRERALSEKVLAEIIASPGISQVDLCRATALHDREVKKGVKILESRGLAIVDSDGPRGSKRHFPGVDASPPSQPSQDQK